MACVGQRQEATEGGGVPVSMRDRKAFAWAWASPSRLGGGIAGAGAVQRGHLTPLRAFQMDEAVDRSAMARNSRVLPAPGGPTTARHSWRDTSKDTGVSPPTAR
jgi:hypothetical protein